MLPGSDAGRLVVVLGGGGGVWGRRGGGKGSQHLEKKKKNEKPTPPAPPSVVEGKYTNHCTTGVLASSRQDKEDRDQDVGSCGSLTCLVYIVCTIYARRESNSDPLLSSCVGEDAFGGGDFSEHKLPLCEIYTPSVTKGHPRETEKRRPRATDTARPSDTARARARGTVPTSLRRRRHHHHLPLSPFAPRRSKRKGKRKRERQPTSRRVWKERWYYFLILIKHRNPHTRRRRRRLSPARSCRWGWSSSSPGRPCARRGP